MLGQTSSTVEAPCIATRNVTVRTSKAEAAVDIVTVDELHYTKQVKEGYFEIFYMCCAIS